jgi:hypothetical protein
MYIWGNRMEEWRREDMGEWNVSLQLESNEERHDKQQFGGCAKWLKLSGSQQRYIC